MSAAPYSPILRARLSRELSRVLAEHSHTAIGEWIGHADTTPTRRGADIDRWPLSELAAIAVRDAEFDRALRLYVQGDGQDSGEAVRALGELLELVASSGDLIHRIMRAADDQRLTPAEARDLRPLIYRLLELGDRACRDLEPIERGI